MPYHTAGFPTLEMSKQIIRALVEAGTDMVEIGVPFSDPLADGKTVQRTSQAALANGTRLVDCVALAARVRSTGIETPLVLMGYYNPFLQYGLDRFAADAATAGVDGVIVPDLPAEEADDFAAACRRHGRDLIFLLAPTSTEARIAAVGQRASGFVYCVSLRGVTGARDRLPDLTEYLARVRRQTDLPLAVGFGVSTAAHVRQVGEAADGAVVASALIDHLDSIPVDEQPAAAEAFVRALRDDAGAIERNRSGASNERG
jgi:tryptophan synthase alpha chain